MAHETTRNGRDYSRPQGGATVAPAVGPKYPTLKPMGLHKSLPAIPINRPITMIGSRRTARVHLTSSQVSKAHALIVMTPTKAYVCDLMSREGTRVKGHAVKELELRDGDELQLGDFKFQFNDPRPRQKSPPPAVEPLALQITVPNGTQRVVLEKRVTLLGRRSGSDVELPFPDVSTANTAIIRLDGFAGEGKSMCFVGWGIFDLGGKGTEVNGRPVHKEQIRAGDIIGIGRARIEVVSLINEGVEKPAARRAAARSAPRIETKPEPRPAVAASSLAPIPVVEEPVTAEDLDAISLDEDLTPGGMELDLLGGSHVMDAISEPQAPAAPVPAEARARAGVPSPGTEQIELSLEELLDAPDGGDLRPATAAAPPRPRFEEQEAEPQDQSGRAQRHSSDEPGGDLSAPSDAAQSEEPADAAGQAAHAQPQAGAEVDLSHIDFDAEVSGSSAVAPQWREAESPLEAYATAGVAASLELEGATARYSEPEEQSYSPAEAEHLPEDDGLTPAERFDAQFGFKAFRQPEEPAEEPAHQPAQVFIEPEAQVEVLEEDVRSEPGQELGVREGELDLDGAPAEPPPVESDLVMSETEPTPQSALDLEPLAAEPETFEHAPAPALSDSAFAMELEALTEEGGMYGPPAPDMPSAQAAGTGEVAASEQSSVCELSGAGDTDAMELAEAPEPEAEIDWSELEAESQAARPEAEPQWTAEFPEPASEAESQWAQPDGADGEAISAPEPSWNEPHEEPAIADSFADVVDGPRVQEVAGAADRTVDSSPDGVAEAAETAPSSRAPWRLEQATFLGNTRAMSEEPVFAMPISARQEPAPPAAESPVAPAEADAAPPGIDEHAPAGWVKPQPAQSAQQHAPSNLDENEFGAVAAPSGHEPSDFSAGGEPVDQPPKPRKVGFAGAVAEIEEPVAPGAATPFSSRPVAGSASPLLDPSMVMPDELPFEPAPVAPVPPRKPLIAGAAASAEAGEAPRSPAVAEPEEELGEDVWARLPREPEDSAAGRSTNGRQNGVATNGQPHVPARDEEQARVDDFLNTIRAGVRGHHGHSVPPDGNGEAATPVPVPETEAPRGDRPRGSVHGQPDWTAAVNPLANPLAEEEEEEAGAGSRLLWQLPLLILVAFLAAAGSAAAIWYGVQPAVTVTMKLRYDFPEELTGDARKAYKDGQRALVVEDSIRQLALGYLQDGSPQVAPGFLEDVSAYNRFALRVDWSSKEPDTLLLSGDVPALERSAESARLKAVATALFDRGGSERAAREQHGGQIEQIEQEIDRSWRQLEELSRQIEEAVARLPLPRDAASDVAQEQGLEERIAKLDEHWSAASRRAVQLREQITSLQHADPIADDRQLAELNRRLTDVEAQIAIFRRRSTQADEPAEAVEAEATGDQIDLRTQFPAAALFEESLLMDADARLAAGRVEGAEPQEAEPPMLLGPRAAGAALQEQIEGFLKQADAAAASLNAQKGEQLKAQAGGFAATMAQLVDETLPAQVRRAGEVELLRQALLRTRRQRSVAMLDEDAGVRTLRGEAALKERELNAAISDGLTDRAAGLRMALRMTRDRLSMRVDEVTARLEDDAKVSEAREVYEKTLRSAGEALAPERAEFEKALAAHRRAVQALAPAGAAALAKAMKELESAGRSLVDDQAIRLPLLAEVWAPAQPASGGEEPAGDRPQSGAPAAEDKQVEEELLLVSLVVQEPPIPATQPSLEEQAADLRRQITARQGELRQEQAQKLAELREQLAAAEAAAAKAQREAQEARGQLAEMRAGQESAIRERQRVSQLRVEKVDLESAINEKQRELKRANDAAGVLATPRPPADVDLVVPPSGDDPRPRLIMIAVSIIGALTLVGLFLTLRSSARA